MKSARITKDMRERLIAKVYEKNIKSKVVHALRKKSKKSWRLFAST